MKIFLSWSGPKSRVAAEALRNWLPDVIQSLDPWMSSVDIGAGKRWGRDLEDQLAAASFGVIIMTAENQSAPWIMFEAGALAKTIKDTFVCPYLVDLAIPSMLPSPLTQFQAKEADKEGTGELLRAINEALGDEALPESRLIKAFERSWPELELILGSLRDEEEMALARRPMEDTIEEVLLISRELAREGVPNTSVGPSNWHDYLMTVSKLGGARLRHPGTQLSPTDLGNVRFEVMRAIWGFFHPIDWWAEYAGSEDNEAETGHEHEGLPEAPNSDGEAGS